MTTEPPDTDMAGVGGSTELKNANTQAPEEASHVPDGTLERDDLHSVSKQEAYELFDRIKVETRRLLRRGIDSECVNAYMMQKYVNIIGLLEEEAMTELFQRRQRASSTESKNLLQVVSD